MKGIIIINSRHRVILCLLFIALKLQASAQVNYVLNPSFEQYSKCPYNSDQITFANYWSPIDTIGHPPLDSFGSPNCTPEYCNKCATNSSFGAPYGGAYFHYPRAGNGMAQVQMFFDENFTISYKRDYLQGRLSKPLITGKSYCVSFFVALEQASTYAVNHIGAYLDDGEIDTTQTCGLPQTTHIPQVQSLNVINDTLNWTKIEGSFIANGTEKFITIGNFYDKANTTYVPSISHGNGGVTWYLVDDVSVVESDIPADAGGVKIKGRQDSVFIGRNEIVPGCSWYRNGVLVDTVNAGFWVHDTDEMTTYVVRQEICGLVKWDTATVYAWPEGVRSVSNAHTYKIYPNPAHKQITIQRMSNNAAATLTICDMSGRIMQQQQVEFVNAEAMVPINLPGGVYLITLSGEDGGKEVQRLSVL